MSLHAVAIRFAKKLEWHDGPMETPCWKWTGYRWNNGYGAFWDGKRLVRAHRWIYERAIGPIPSGLQIDHLCRVRDCANPSHLEVVTPRTNTLRGESPGAVRARAANCKRGHPFSSENTYLFGAHGGQRSCRACHRFVERMRRQARHFVEAH